MIYKVDGWNNFCRVFQLPSTFPKGYCFGGGKEATFLMLDWFNPVTDLPQPAVSKITWEKEVGPINTKEMSDDYLRKSIIPFLQKKDYVKKGNKYLVLCDFGASFIFTK